MPRSTFVPLATDDQTPLAEEPRSRVNAMAITLFFVIFALVFGVMLALVGIASHTDAQLLPPCPTEDSTHCYWDADTMGNHQGNDIVAP
jgi:hypothetical protein